MACVWQAEDLILKRQVAIKLLLVDRAPQGSQMIERFLREARIAASVQHRNVIHTADFGTEHGQPFMVMELLDGETLRSRLSRAPRMTQHRVVHVVSLTLRGLAAIHDAQVIHRDLKPENIFLQSDSQAVFPKIIDFGVALNYGPGGDGLSVFEPRQGFVAGSPAYMSPEQARGEADIDPRTDIYSMGVILYEALTGELPFESMSVDELLQRIELDAPLTVSELAPDVAQVFSDLVAKAMSKNREDRFDSARSMRAALLQAAADVWPEHQTSSNSLAPQKLGRAMESLYPAAAETDPDLEFLRTGLNSSLPAIEPEAEFEAAADAAGQGQLKRGPAPQQSAGRPRSARKRSVVAVVVAATLSLALLAFDTSELAAMTERVKGAIQPLMDTLRRARTIDVRKELSAAPVHDLQPSRITGSLIDAYGARLWFRDIGDAEPATCSLPAVEPIAATSRDRPATEWPALNAEPAQPFSWFEP